MRGRPSLARGVKRRARQTAVGVEARPRADQRQRLRDGCALGLQVVVPHSTSATVSGRPLPSARWRASTRSACAFPSAMAKAEGCGRGRSRGCSGRSAGWRAYGSDRRPARAGRSGRRARATGPATSLSSASAALAAARPPKPPAARDRAVMSDAFVPAASEARTSGSSTTPWLASAMAARRSARSSGYARGRRRAGRWDQRVLELENTRGQPLDLARGVRRPERLRRRKLHGSGLGLDQLRQHAALLGVVGPRLPPPVDGGLEVEQPR